AAASPPGAGPAGGQTRKTPADDGWSNGNVFGSGPADFPSALPRVTIGGYPPEETACARLPNPFRGRPRPRRPLARPAGCAPGGNNVGLRFTPEVVIALGMTVSAPGWARAARRRDWWGVAARWPARWTPPSEYRATRWRATPRCSPGGTTWKRPGG